MTLPCPLHVGGEPVLLRRALRDDVAAIVRLLAEDQLGGQPDRAGTEAELAAYLTAFDAIDADPRELLVVAETGAGVIGTLQVSILLGLSRRGAARAQIEAVRVASGLRGRGLGRAMIGWAVAEARERGCAQVQLTSNKARGAAHRFYLRLGFANSHEAFKLRL